ncbi:hypothetical protein A9Q82_05810 [Cycloclasticus sp. 46_120_T64]|nr:hypothetical protein A9Q82_05810 [Cycloclasticus sp. 46_120_T64]
MSMLLKTTLEEAQRKTEAAQFALNEHSLVSMTDIKGNIISVNKKFIEVSGYSEAELIGQNHRLLNSANQSKDYWREMYLTVSKGKPWHDEVRNTAKDGHHYWVDTTIVPNFDNQHKLIGYTSIRTDISQSKENAALLEDAQRQAEDAQKQAEDAQKQAEDAQKQAETALKQAETALKQAETARLALNEHSLVSMTDIKGNIISVNKKFIEVSGYSEAELIGQNHRLLNSANQPKDYWREMYLTVSKGQPWHDEVRNTAKDGHYYWVDTTIVPNHDIDHKLIGYTSTMTDIKGNIISVNKKFIEVSGYSEAELIGQNHRLLNSANQSKDYWREMYLTVSKGKPWHDEVRNTAKDGHHYWVDTTIVPNFDNQHKLIGYTSIRTDISQSKENAALLEDAQRQAEDAQKQAEDAQKQAEDAQKQAETALKQAETALKQAETALKQAETALKQAETARLALNEHSLVSMTDIKGNIISVNKKFIEVSGYSEAELIGQNHRLLNSANQPKDYWREMYLTVSKGQPWHDEVRNTAKDGHYYWVDTTIVPNHDIDHKLIGYTSTMTDIKGNIISVNKKFIEVSGYSEAELIGQNHRLLNSANQPKDYWREMYLTVSKGQPWHDEVRNTAKDGHYYWVDTTIVPNHDIDHKLIGYTSIRTDITTQKETIEKLAIAKAEAEVANISKTDFLANMSHEIRTPMNGVIGMTNLLLDSQLSAEQHKLAKTVKSSGESLLGIINDILDFSKVEAGKLDLEYLNFNLGQLVEDLGNTLSFQTDNKGIQLICPASPIIQQWVKADPGRIRQILTNLIGNAIKFTDQGEVAVFVSIEDQGLRKQVLFEVKDTGIGIDQQQQKKLFDQFSQADTSTTRKYGGTGLGLSISKKLVELMGGEVGVHSTLGQGSNFWFSLDLDAAEHFGEEKLSIDNLDKQKLLIVDDNATNRDLMHQLHDIWGIPHALAASGKAALIELSAAATSGAPYTLVILDMNMPEMDGLELSKVIHASPALQGVKLIMATSHAQRGDAKKMQAAGFNGYLTKPIHQSELFDVVVQVSGLSDSSKKLITRFTSREKYQFKGHILVVEDNVTNQLVIQGLLSNFGLSVDLAANGEEAIAALQRGNHHDLVFMDCQMPVMDGYIATTKIREAGTGLANPAIPVIAMTANAMAGDKEKCLSAGMDDYIAKPIDPEKVANMLEHWLPERIRRKVSTNSLPAEQPDTESKKLIFDFDDMSKRLMHKPALMKAVSEQFYIDLHGQINELKLSIEQNNTELAGVIGHTIKGASASVGGLELSELALKIEIASKANDMDSVSSYLPILENSFTSLKTTMQEKLKEMTDS